uniref:Uncharacterized protein n=1 Tax=Macaca fascicularis TaxID=9541 RepID=A0A7N9CU03_MACFA
ILLRALSLVCSCFSSSLSVLLSLPFLTSSIRFEVVFHVCRCNPILSDHKKWCLPHKKHG